MTATAMIRADATGADLVRLIRAAAHARGVTLTEFMRPIAVSGPALLGTMEKAQRPKPETVDRIAALLEGDVQPEVSPRRRTGWRKDLVALEPEQQRQREAIFAALVAAAETARPCPPNTTLARDLGMNASTVANRVNQLVADGRITVSRSGKRQRIIAIVATGRATAPAVAANGMSDDDWRQSPVARSFDREPCFQCGVRGDIGCVHRPLEMRA